MGPAAIHRGVAGDAEEVVAGAAFQAASRMR